MSQKHRYQGFSSLGKFKGLSELSPPLSGDASGRHSHRPPAFERPQRRSQHRYMRSNANISAQIFK
jgi:hypothetical protein